MSSSDDFPLIAKILATMLVATLCVSMLHGVFYGIDTCPKCGEQIQNGIVIRATFTSECEEK